MRATGAVVGPPTGWRDEVVKWFDAEGYLCPSFDDAASLSKPTRVLDFVVLDVSVGAPDVADVCALARAHGAPVLAIVTHPTSEAAVLGAFSAGADQVVSDAVYPVELLARVRSLLRRSAPRPRDESGHASVGDLLRLTDREAMMLELLVTHPSRVVSRDQLVAAGIGPGRSVDAVARRLREKLEAIEGRRRIVTVRGVGFRFLDEEERR